MYTQELIVDGFKYDDSHQSQYKHSSENLFEIVAISNTKLVWLLSDEYKHDGRGNKFLTNKIPFFQIYEITKKEEVYEIIIGKIINNESYLKKG